MPAKESSKGAQMAFWQSKDSTAETAAALRSEIDVVTGMIEQRMREAQFRQQQENRLIPYLYLSLAGVVGIFFRFDQLQPAYEFLVANPISLLIAGILLMWFPIYSAVAQADEAKALLHVRDELVPFRDHLIKRQRALLNLSVPARFDAVFAWSSPERERVMFGRVDLAISHVILPLAWFRTFFVALPAIGVFVCYFVARYFAVVAGTFGVPLPAEIGLFLLVAVLLSLMVLTAFTWTLKRSYLR